MADIVSGGFRGVSVGSGRLVGGRLVVLEVWLVIGRVVEAGDTWLVSAGEVRWEGSGRNSLSEGNAAGCEGWDSGLSGSQVRAWLA